MKHIFLLQIATTPFFIREVSEDKLHGYTPDKDGKMILISVARDQLPIDNDMIEEIKEILN